MRYRTVLFDLDGTLLDTNELIIASFLHTLKQFCPEKAYTREDIIPQMGKTLRDMLRLFHSQQVEEMVLEEMVKVYREHNLANHDQMVTAFPHVLEVVQELHQGQVKMGIVTTKQRNTTERGLRLCQLDTYMDTVVTIGDVEHPKPHPQPVQTAMVSLGADPQTTIMVGDSPFDIEAAHRAGIAVAGVSWSLKGEEYLRAFSPDYMLKDMRDLLELVEGS